MALASRGAFDHEPGQRLRAIESMAEQRLMRIAYVSLHADLVGGGEYSLLDLMKHLPKACTPVLITPKQGSFSQKVAEHNISVHCLPMPKLGLASILTLRPWLKYLRKFAPHIIHANNSRAAFYAGLAGRLLGVPVVFHCRIADSDGLMDKLLMRLCSAIVCNSQAVAKRFSQAHIPVHVVYNGLTFAKPSDMSLALLHQLPEQAKLLLFVGRISREKQVEKALQVFGKLAEQDSSFYFAIVGGEDALDKGYVQSLQQSVANKPWASRVIWAGQQTDVAAWYQAASVLILTSKHEGFGRVLVEAMAYGLPSVAFAVGGVPEVIEDGKQGFLIAPNHVSDMADACAKLLHDEALYQAMVESGKQRAVQFSVGKHVEGVLRVYKEVLNER